MEEQGRNLITEAMESKDDVDVEILASMRYIGQGYNVEVEIPKSVLSSQNISEIQPEETNGVEGEIVEPNLRKLENLISAGDAAEAFFLARSLFTSGDEWAEEWMLKAQEML